jgi:hypothetical protein
VEKVRASIGNFLDTVVGRFERTLIICGAFAAGSWLWPAGFLFGPVSALTPRIVFLAASAMGVLAIACLMMIFVAAEPVAALMNRLQRR